MTIQVSLSQLAYVQNARDRIRNVCILAHVDHGKTTLSDHLIGANGLIHPKMAGELRYLDAREDEQARGITMKSSAISLMHIPGREQALTPDGKPLKKAVGNEELRNAYLVNLIDSPGHVDFCSEVSTAVRLCDGALVVVDCVEGVCIQTHAVLRQAFQERVKPVLVLNKIDRLILEQQMTPLEAYEHLVRIVGDVNNVVSGFQSESYLKEADDLEERRGDEEQQEQEQGDTAAEGEAEELMFCPTKGNVAFASAADGWGFRIAQFATMVAAKLNAKPQALQRALWGEYYFQAKAKSVTRKRPSSGKAVPMFVQFVLEPLWKAYTAVDPDTDAVALLTKMVESLSLPVSDRDVQRSDRKSALKTVLRAWLPLSESVLGMATEHLPSPSAAAPLRLPRLMPPPPEVPEAADAAGMVERVREAVGACSSALQDPVVVYVSKMISVPSATLPRNPGDPAPGPGEVFLAFGRVFSGVVRQGQRLHVLSAAYNPAKPEAGQRRTAVVRAMYLMMGTGLERLGSVPAGNVLALEGFDETILKTATLCSTPAAPSMAPMTFQAAPVVRVALEPALPSEITQLRRGLELLNKADPMVEVTVLDTGEFVLGTAGEVHLETCIKDLQERFARIKLEVSPPLVAFRESVADVAEEAKVDSGMSSRPVRCVESTTANGVCTIRIRALPLPNKLAESLEAVGQEYRQAAGGTPMEGGPGGSCSVLKERLEAAAEECEDGKRGLQRIGCAWSLGPRNVGPNVLMSSEKSAAGSLWSLPSTAVLNLSAGRQQKQSDAAAADDKAGGVSTPESSGGSRVPLGRAVVARQLGFGDDAAERPLGECSDHQATQVPEEFRGAAGAVESGIQSGFQMAAAAGPLCDEPMWGVAFEVEARLNVRAGEAVQLAEDVYGPFSGQVTSTAKDAFRRALIEAGPRLVEAMYLCEVATSSEALAGVYAALGRRRSRILLEDMREGSDTFIIQASLPVEASFGFAAEIRRRGRGAESPSLMFSHWERLQIDPYFVPMTEEEREEFGEQGQGFTEPNLAKRFIDQVRRRKGIMVEEKIVESATKQRTLARKV